MELANGFQELCDPSEQRARFEAEQRAQLKQGQPARVIDENLLAALDAGLPACAGVALGVDRLLMKIMKKQHIKDVLSFDWERV